MFLSLLWFLWRPKAITGICYGDPFFCDCCDLAPNPCATDNGGCSQLCLLSATSPSGYSCACADGFLPSDSFSSQCVGRARCFLCMWAGIKGDYLSCSHCPVYVSADAPIYQAEFCMSSVPAVGCPSWIVRVWSELHIMPQPFEWLFFLMQVVETDKKLFQVGEVMVTSVEEICQCGFNSSSLISTSNSSFSCHPDDPTIVVYQGLVYGISITNNMQLVNSFHEWAASNASIQIYGDTLYIGCTISTQPSATMTPAASGSPTPVDVTLVVALVIGGIGLISLPISVCCCVVIASFFWKLGWRQSIKRNMVGSAREDLPPSYDCVQARLACEGVGFLFVCRQRVLLPFFCRRLN